VTTLEDNGSTSLVGSLRWALNQASPKTILFKVSGTIMLKSGLSISKGQTTIAGQSAPGDGICIGGNPVTISANDVIIRFVRFRMGDAFKYRRGWRRRTWGYATGKTSLSITVP
jgi:hypothetical protein